MFFGEYDGILDKSGKLKIPLQHRELEQGGYVDKFYLMIDHKNSGLLNLYIPKEFWEENSKQSLQPGEHLGELSDCCEVKCDENGYITIPQEFIEGAHLKKTVSILGALSRIEIRSK